MSSQDSTQPTPDSMSQQAYRTDPRRSLFILIVSIVLVGLFLIQLEDLDWSPLLILSGFFVVGMVFQKSWSIYLSLAILFVVRFESQPRALGVQLIGMEDLVFTVVALLLAGLCFRYLELTKLMRVFHPAIRLSKINPDQKETQFPSLMGGRWWLMPIAVLTAYFVLQFFPHDPESAQKYWITSEGSRIIFLMYFLFFAWFVCRSLIRIVMRWNIAQPHAEIQARSLVAQEFWRERAGVEMRLVKLRQKNEPD
ncbi:MAG: hypothetical protein ACI814_004220 [Mariniblastus sp.]|jgi:hypothetical protein